MLSVFVSALVFLIALIAAGIIIYFVLSFFDLLIALPLAAGIILLSLYGFHLI